MSKLRVHGFSVSLDGYGAGPDQSLEEPLGRGAESLHEWLVTTRTFQQRLQTSTPGTTGPDDDLAALGFENLGAWILGRNMFGPPGGGPWKGDSWRGWWGENPPYHVPVFVLTHHARAPVEMEGGTVFHFVTDGIEAALTRAREAAGPRDIRLGGGVSTIRQYLNARWIDELHLAFSPVLLGGGESLFAGVDLPSLGYRVQKHVTTVSALHVVIAREAVAP